jgi:hypothetical protein
MSSVPTSVDHSAAFVQLVALMASQNGMAATTMRKHANDGTGHCRLCTAGAQTGRYAWPCQTYLAAEEAAASMTGPATHSTRSGRV